MVMVPLIVMAYLHVRTQTSIRIYIWISVPKMGTVAIGDLSTESVQC